MKKMKNFLLNITSDSGWGHRLEQIVLAFVTIATCYAFFKTIINCFINQYNG